MKIKSTLALVAGLAVTLLCSHASAQTPLLARLQAVRHVASTVPVNGDLNPYGVVRVPVTTGNLVEGHILVSNFNNSTNLQGTGTTIVDIDPKGTMRLFAHIDAGSLPAPCPGGIGLTTALVALRSGWVIVGSLPTSDGMADTAQAGCLLVLDSRGKVVETFSGDPINGPWDMTVRDSGSRAVLFVTNVLNGTVAAGGTVVNGGTVLRVVLDTRMRSMPRLMSMTVIGSGFPERTDPAALVIGPTGVALSANAGVLYVNDTLGNRIAALSQPMTRTASAGTGVTLSSGGSLNNPLGLSRDPSGDLIAANANDGNLVEITPAGQQVSTILGESAGAGSLFGVFAEANKVFFVDDATNALNVLEKH